MVHKGVVIIGLIAFKIKIGIKLMMIKYNQYNYN